MSSVCPLASFSICLQTSHDVEELGNFLNEAVAAGTEGLIVKSMDSTYEPSKRSVNWLKLKKDYLEGVGDTFDVVPIGAWHGRLEELVSLGNICISSCSLVKPWAG